MSAPLQILLIILSFIAGLVISGTLKIFPDLLPDVPNARSSHTKTIPRGGGLGFSVSFIIALFVLIVVFHKYNESDFQALIFGAVLFSLLGLADDAFQLSAAFRLFFQLLTASVAVLWGAKDSVNFFGVLDIHGWPVYVFQILWIVAVVNLYNFMDGIDGLAAINGIFISFILGLVFYFNFKGFFPFSESKIETRIFSTSFFCLSSAIFGFLVWNFPPAKLFMGDTGSYFLGFVFSFTAVLFPGTVTQKTRELNLNLVLWEDSFPIIDFSLFVLLLTPFLLDSGITLIRRFYNKENLFLAHRKHFYQLYFRNSGSALKTDMIFLGLGALSIIPILIKIFYSERSLFVFSFFGVIIFLAAFFVRAIRHWNSR